MATRVWRQSFNKNECVPVSDYNFEQQTLQYETFSVVNVVATVFVCK